MYRDVLGFLNFVIKCFGITYEGCSEIIETLAVNKLLKKLQVLFLVVR